MNQHQGSVKTRATKARAAYGHQAQLGAHHEENFENMGTMARLQKALTPPEQILNQPWKVIGVATAAAVIAGYVLGLSAFVRNEKPAEELA